MYWTSVSTHTLVSVGEGRIMYDHVAQRPGSATAFVSKCVVKNDRMEHHAWSSNLLGSIVETV